MAHGILWAGGWASIPQPLVLGYHGDRYVAKADAGSSLVMHSAQRVLYSVSYGQLNATYWMGRTFLEQSVAYALNARETDQEAMFHLASVKRGSALVMDQAWGMVYYITNGERLICCRRAGGLWNLQVMVDEPLTHVLGVDQRWHLVYAYDAARRVIVVLRWDSADKGWRSQVIARDVGAPAAEGAVDSSWHVLYSVHKDAPGAWTTQAGGTQHAWPLLATWWDGSQWTSQVVDVTGVPQRPGVHAATHRVFYSRRDELDATRWFQPPANPFTTIRNRSGGNIRLLGKLLDELPRRLGATTDTLGNRSYLDNDSWPVDLNPDYLWSGGVVTTSTGLWGWKALQPPFTPVVCYVPQLTEIPLSDRVSGSAFVVHPRRAELVQQRSKRLGGVVYVPSGWTAVPNVLKDANGHHFFATPDANQTIVSPPFGSSYYLTRVSSPAELLGNPHATLDPNAPLPPAYESKAPSTIQTFGYRLAKRPTLSGVGGRFQDYAVGQDRQGAVGGIAVDSATRFTFYTQAPTPDEEPSLYDTPDEPQPPQAARFGQPVGRVWVVVVY